jgi:hypothetical protein
MRGRRLRVTARAFYRRPRRAMLRPADRGRVPRAGPFPQVRHDKSRLRRARLPQRFFRTTFAIQSSMAGAAPTCPSLLGTGPSERLFLLCPSAGARRHPDTATDTTCLVRICGASQLPTNAFTVHKAQRTSKEVPTAASRIEDEPGLIISVSVHLQKKPQRTTTRTKPLLFIQKNNNQNEASALHPKEQQPERSLCSSSKRTTTRTKPLLFIQKEQQPEPGSTFSPLVINLIQGLRHARPDPLPLALRFSGKGNAGAKRPDLLPPC